MAHVNKKHREGHSVMGSAIAWANTHDVSDDARGVLVELITGVRLGPPDIDFGPLMQELHDAGALYRTDYEGRNTAYSPQTDEYKKWLDE